MMSRFSVALVVVLGTLCMEPVHAQQLFLPEGIAVPSDVKGMTVEEAETQVRKTSGTYLERGTDTAKKHSNAINVLRSKNAIEELIAKLERERTLETQPSNPPLIQVLAGLYETQGKFEISRKLFHEAAAKNPDDLWLTLKSADFLQATSDAPRFLAAMAAVWEKAPQMALSQPQKVGSWYAVLGITDGLPEAVAKLTLEMQEPANRNALNNLLSGLQTKQLKPEQLDPVYLAAIKILPRHAHADMHRRRAGLFYWALEPLRAYAIYEVELFFPAYWTTPQDFESDEAQAAASVALQSVSEFADMAFEVKKVDELSKAAATKLLARPGYWKDAGELLIAALERRKTATDQKLLAIAKRLREQTPKLAFDDVRLMAVKREIEGAKSDAAGELLLSWSRADEESWVTRGRSRASLRYEQAVLLNRLRRVKEARALIGSLRESSGGDLQIQIADTQQAANFAAMNAWHEEALVLYFKLLRDLVPQVTHAGFASKTDRDARFMAGKLLEQLPQISTQMQPDARLSLLSALLEILFPDGATEEPVLPVKVSRHAVTKGLAKESAVGGIMSPRPYVMSGLGPTVMQLAHETGELKRLRAEWAKHPQPSSLALLTLRAEGAAIDGDLNELAEVMKSVEPVSESTGYEPAFWSSRCILFGFADRLQQAVEFNFRDRQWDRRAFDPSGASPWLVKSEAEGLRIRLPENTGAIGHVGTMSKFRIHGDFEAIATYEILQIEKPILPKFYGGAMLITEFVDSPEHTNLRRERHADGNDYYTPHRHSLSAQEQVETAMQHIPTQAMKGQMVLVRRGGTMYWLARDDGQPDFRVLQQGPCAQQDVSTLKLAIDSWGTQSLTDLRWLDLTIRAESLPNLPSELLRKPTEIVAASVAPPPVPRVQWHWWLVTTLALGITVVGLIRRRRRTA